MLHVPFYSNCTAKARKSVLKGEEISGKVLWSFESFCCASDESSLTNRCSLSRYHGILQYSDWILANTLEKHLEYILFLSFSL